MITAERGIVLTSSNCSNTHHFVSSSMKDGKRLQRKVSPGVFGGHVDQWRRYLRIKTAEEYWIFEDCTHLERSELFYNNRRYFVFITKHSVCQHLHPKHWRTSKQQESARAKIIRQECGITKSWEKLIVLNRRKKKATKPNEEVNLKRVKFVKVTIFFSL